MPTDYLALAQQFGGEPDDDPTEEADAPEVDYLALAKQFGGAVDTTAPEAPPLAGGTGAAPAAVSASGGGDTSVWGRLGLTPRSALRSVAGDIDRHVEVGKGAAKGLGNSAVGFADLMRATPGLGHAIDATNRLAGISPEAMDQVTTRAREALAPTNALQKAGFYGEQLGEVMLPGKLITKGAEATAAKLSALGLRPKVASVLGRSAAEGVAGGVLSKIQGGDPETGAVMGAASPLVSAGARAFALPLRKSAEKGVMQALGPTKERFKAMAEKITPEVLTRRLGGSRESLKAVAASATAKAGRVVEATLAANANQVVNTKPILDALDEAKRTYRITEEMPLAEAVAKKYVTVGANGQAIPAPGVEIRGNGTVARHVDTEPRAVAQLEALQQIVTDLGDDLPVEKLVALRRTWDNVVAQAGGFSHRAPGAIGLPLADTSEAAAKRTATTAIRKLLDAEVPDLTAVNREFAFWKSLDDVLGQTMQRTEPQSRGLLRQVARGSGAALGGIAGYQSGGVVGGMGGAVVATQIADKIERFFTSPRWKLASAKTKDRLASALASGDPKRVDDVIGRVAATTTSKATTGRSAAPATPAIPRAPQAKR